MTEKRAVSVAYCARELADEIIAAQRREIREMDWLIADIRANGPAASQAEAEARPVPDFSGAPD